MKLYLQNWAQTFFIMPYCTLNFKARGLRAGQESDLVLIHQGDNSKVFWDIPLQYRRYDNIWDVFHIFDVFTLSTEIVIFKISDAYSSCCTPVFPLYCNSSRRIRYPYFSENTMDKKHKASSPKIKRELEKLLPSTPLPCFLASGISIQHASNWHKLFTFGQ